MDIPDDPIIRSIERTGYPHWYRYPVDNDREDDDEDDEEEDDEIYP